MTADRIIMGFEDWVARHGVVATATDAAPANPAQNVTTTRIGVRWRSTDLNAVLTIDLGQDREAGLLVLRFPRDVPMPGGDLTHKLDEASGTAGAGATYDSGSIPIDAVEGYGYHVHVLPAAVNARWWTVEFAATNASSIDVGRAFASPAWRPDIGASWGLSEAWGDLSSVVMNDRSGAEFVDGRSRRRALEFGLANMRDAEREVMREFARVSGISQQIVACWQPATDAARCTILGRMADATPIAWARYNINQRRFVIRETL